MTDGVYVREYDLIVNSAHVVRGVFCGHRHVSMVSQILAKTPEGTSAVILQIIINGVYSHPYAMKITVK